MGQFASGLVAEIEQDRKVLQAIIDRVGKKPPNLKQAAGWLGEKMSAFKLKRDTAGGLGTFEALAILALGILGRIALCGHCWQYARPPRKCTVSISSN
jgi:hypothetical protein